MAAVRVSPGMYKDPKTGKVYKAENQAQADAMISGAAKKTTPEKKTPTTKPANPLSESSPAVQKQIKSDIQVQDIQADKNIQLNNPNVTNDFGNQTVTRNADGSVNVNQSLSADQKAILDKGSKLTQMGQDFAQQGVSNYKQFDPSARTAGYKPFAMGQDLVGERARIEDSVYKSLTKNTDRDYAREKAQLEQDLYNRGIPLNPEDPQYKQHMGALNERYDQIRADAQGQAVQMGGQEYQRAYDIGSGSHNINTSDMNTLNNIDLGAHQQNVADMSSLSNLGTGLQLPNFPQFQGTSMQLTNPSTIDLALKQFGLDKRKTDIAAQQAQRSGGGSSSNGGGAVAQSPFNPTTIS